jgi:hypothetical protein
MCCGWGAAPFSASARHDRAGETESPTGDQGVIIGMGLGQFFLFLIFFFFFVLPLFSNLTRSLWTQRRHLRVMIEQVKRKAPQETRA